jgi:HlyD family secretion protein
MMKKNYFAIIAALTVALIFIVFIAYLIPKGPSNGELQTIGIIEATEVNLSSKINERISDVKFKEGDRVKKGDTAIVLDAEKIKAHYAQAQANLEVAEAGFLNAQADIERAKVKIEDTLRDVERMNRLLEKKLISQNDKDKAQTNYDLSVADLKKAEAQGTLAGASIKASQAALAVAKTNLDDTVISSTVSGVVTLKAFEPGEMVPVGAVILSIVDTSDVWVRVDVEETFVAKIKLGEMARVLIDALPTHEFLGRISEINSEGEFATQTDVKRGKQDIKTFRVKVKIEEPGGVLKPGMTATVKFHPG